MWPLLIPAITQILDKLIPDPQAKAQAQLDLARMVQTGELAELDFFKQVAVSQAATNTAEASRGGFHGGWRPFIGWVCGAGFAYQYLVRPMLPWTMSLFGVSAPAMPELETGEIMGLVFGMLGLGGLRTYEKRKGIA